MTRKTLMELLPDYLEHMKARRASYYTVRITRYGNLDFLKWLREDQGVVSGDALRRAHLESFQKYLAERATTKGRLRHPKTTNRQISVVKGFLRYLGHHGYVASSLEMGIEYVKEPKVLPGSVLSHDQARRLLESVAMDTPAGHRDRTMLELLYTSGIRAGELLGLDVGSVTFSSGTARVMGKGEKERIVPIGKTALALLENYVKGVRPFLVREPGEQALFLNGQGKRFVYFVLLKLVHAHARKAGLTVNVTPHTFRRSCTTELLRGGAGMYHVKELLGHESLDTLKHYAKLTINDLKQEHQRCHPREKDGETRGLLDEGNGNQ